MIKNVENTEETTSVRCKKCLPGKFSVRTYFLIASFCLALWGVYWYLTPVTHDVDLSKVTNVWLPFLPIGKNDMDSMFDYPTVELDRNRVMEMIGNSEHKRIFIGNQPLVLIDNRIYVVFEDAAKIKHLAWLYPRSAIIWFSDSDRYYQISDSDRDNWDQYVVTLSRSRNR